MSVKRTSFPAVSITIRLAILADAPALAAMMREMSLFPQLSQEPPDAIEARFENNLRWCLSDQSHAVYVAQNSHGTILGYASVHWVPFLIFAGPEGYVSEVFVRENMRGKDIGSRLLDTIIDQARQRKCHRLSLINMRNRESYQRQFYEKRGWKEQPERASFVYLLT